MGVAGEDGVASTVIADHHVVFVCFKGFKGGLDLLDCLGTVLGHVTMVKHLAKALGLAFVVGKAELITVMNAEGFKE